MAKPDTSGRKRGTATRRLLVTLGTIVVAIALGSAWLLRDPTPHFTRQRSSFSHADTLAASSESVSTDMQLRLHAVNGFTVDIAVRRPLAPALGGLRRRLFVILGGQRAGKEAALLFPDTRGAVVAAVEYPYHGAPNPKGLAVAQEVPAIRRAILDTPPAIQLTLDYLLGEPDVDTTRVELIGASFGAPFAAIVAALDQRVSRLWLLHGAADPYRLLEHNLRRYVTIAPLRSVVAGAANVLIAGPRLDPVRWVPRVSPRPVIMINALDDERIPRELVGRLYNSACEPKEQYWLPGLHMQRNRRDILTSLVDTVMALAERDSLR